MAHDKDPYGAKNATTEYQLKGRPKASKSKAKSIAGVVVTGFLALAVLMIFFGKAP